MHPIFVSTLVRDRHTQLQRARQRHARAPATHHACTARPDTFRQRLGWLLIHWGLRLATADNPVVSYR